MKSARIILAENLRTLMARNPHLASQNAIGRASKVGQTTIGNWLRQEYSSQRLEQVESVAKVFGVTVGELLSENFGKETQNSGHPGLSDSVQSIIQRLATLEREQQSPQELYDLIEKAIDLIEPRKPRGAPALRDMKSE